MRPRGCTAFPWPVGGYERGDVVGGLEYDAARARSRAQRTHAVGDPEAEAENSEANQSPARAALGELPVKGRAPKTDYSREQFGVRWADTDRNGCDTRNDILRRDLTNVAVATGTQGCKVLSGNLTSPFTAAHVDFVSGAQTSADVQIDHVVACPTHGRRVPRI
ncbi:HNH endonuclease family protein [Kocuria atrinae]|uniref:HNH endonuclease family protein n=1 Tax=Kocuria atrinae TaxID=592377 RepID=UPI0002F8DBDC|nr:HNH endonuclease family protein [Kocuria atrinae]